MLTFLKNIFTARDNESFSLTKLFGIAGIVAMVHNFIATASTDFNGFGLGVAGLMAAMVAKYFVEDKGAKNE